MQPKKFFDSNPEDLEQVVKVVRDGFGRSLGFQDIYQHVTNPESVYLLRNGEIKAMASYNSREFCGFKSLVVEGIAISPEVQGKGIFSLMTKNAMKSNLFVYLRTQNPRMYRALERCCGNLYPNPENHSGNLNHFLREFADYLGCTMDEKGVVRGCYGGLLYGGEPTHPTISRFFKEDLQMDLSKGDAVLVMG